MKMWIGETNANLPVITKLTNLKSVFVWCHLKYLLLPGNKNVTLKRNIHTLKNKSNFFASNYKWYCKDP